jgi:hypothetical protein
MDSALLPYGVNLLLFCGHNIILDPVVSVSNRFSGPYMPSSPYKPDFTKRRSIPLHQRFFAVARFQLEATARVEFPFS